MSHFTGKNLNNQQLTPVANAVEVSLLKVQKMWRIFYADDNSVFELRALWPKGLANTQQALVRHFKVAQYPSLAACKADFENAALELNSKGYNIYTVMNPISPSFQGKGAAKDMDILYRDLLLVDIDRTGNSDESATEEELNAAKSLAIQVRAYMLKRGWPDPFVMMSGNGYHLYYVLDEVGNTQSDTDLVKSVLCELASKFDNSKVSVDTSVFNASRITKVPGTIMRKGMESVNRPYRVAEVCDEL